MRILTRLAFVSSAAAIILAATMAAAQTPANVDWTSYAADDAGSRFKPLDQINASNFSNLEVAWRVQFCR